MRFFATEGGTRSLMVEPLRIVAEYVGGGNLDDPIGSKGASGADWDEEWCFSEEELLAKEGGRQALEAWRAGDDTAHAEAIRGELAADEFDDELVRAGFLAHPELHEHLQDAIKLMTPPDWAAADRILNEVRKAGAEALGQDR